MVSVQTIRILIYLFIFVFWIKYTPWTDKAVREQAGFTAVCIDSNFFFSYSRD